MTIQEKYDEFAKQYWLDIKDIKKKSKLVGDLFERLGAPLTKAEWLRREYEEAIENEEYEYCNQIKQEIEKL